MTDPRPIVFDADPEIRDPPEKLEKNLLELIELVQKPEIKVTFLIGAGISSSILPTYRGTNGVLTSTVNQNPNRNVSISDVQPTLAHRALVQLEKTFPDKVYFVVTTNYDGLLSKAGFKQSKLSEWHGNIFREGCEKRGCKKGIYVPDYPVTTYDPLNKNHDHATGRKCDACGEDLYDTIVDYGQPVSTNKRNLSRTKLRNKDLCIVLGSKLEVAPSNSYPFSCKKVCIVNLQKTQMDGKADMIIHASCDDVMNSVATSLLGENWYT